MDKQYKTIDVEVVEQDEGRGKIIISTGANDRVMDSVSAKGLSVENYMRNPVVQYGHNYSEPWSTVGRTLSLELDPQGRWVAEFELREPASPNDPQHIVRMLWARGLLRAASIGFMPLDWEENSKGGFDFVKSELLEWSLVPVPMNQEALRLAVKALTPAEPSFDSHTGHDLSASLIRAADALEKMVSKFNDLPSNDASRETSQDMPDNELTDAEQYIDDNETPTDDDNEHGVDGDELEKALAKFGDTLRIIQEKLT